MRKTAVLIVLVFLLPTGAATSVAARLALAEPLELDGSADLRAEVGIVDLSAASEVVSLTWEGLRGYRVERSISTTATGQQLGAGDASRNDTLAGEAGSLRIECRDACVVAVFARPGGSLSSEGLDLPRLAPIDAPTTFWAMHEGPGAADSFYYEASRGWMGAPATALTGAGALSLFAWNATVVLRFANGTEARHETGVEREPLEGPLGIPIGESVERAFVVIDLDGAALALGPAAQATLYAPSFRAAFSGDLVAPRASGTLEVAGATRTLEAERIDILGATVELDLSWASTSEILPLATGSTTGDLTVEGDADRVIVGSQPIVSPTAYAAPIAGLALVAILLVALLRFPGALFLLFSRISRSDVLDNDNRRRLFEGITTRPGQNVTEVARGAGVAEVVARHHLRVLEQCRMIVVRPHGRARILFPAEAAGWAGHGALLRDPTRRAVAELVLATSAGVTQKDVVERLGLSQRLASYHLTQLEKAGLVVAEGERPRRYLPSQALAQVQGPAVMVTSAEG